MKIKITYLFKLVAILAVVNLLLFAKSYSQQYTEYEIKAAFLCNFAKFVEWPEEVYDSDTSSIIIGILGNDPFGPVLERIAKNVFVNNRKIVINRYQDVEKAFYCHILFISSSMDEQLQQTLNALIGTHVLTVSEMEDFSQMGGMINFSKQEIKYGFNINAKAALRAELQISSKLLKLATIVE